MKKKKMTKQEAAVEAQKVCREAEKEVRAVLEQARTADGQSNKEKFVREMLRINRAAMNDIEKLLDANKP